MFGEKSFKDHRKRQKNYINMNRQKVACEDGTFWYFLRTLYNSEI
jgi:hypothetical protein